MNQNLPAFLDLVELAKQLHMSKRNTYRLVAKNVMPIYRPGRFMLFKAEDVVTFLETTKSSQRNID